MKQEQIEDFIDESEEVQGPSSEIYYPKLKETGYHLKTVRDISRIFIVLSFALMAMIIAVGFFKPEFSKYVLGLVWDKIAAVYLVIFGHMLGKNGK